MATASSVGSRRAPYQSARSPRTRSSRDAAGVSRRERRERVKEERLEDDFERREAESQCAPVEETEAERPTPREEIASAGDRQRLLVDDPDDQHLPHGDANTRRNGFGKEPPSLPNGHANRAAPRSGTPPRTPGHSTDALHVAPVHDTGGTKPATPSAAPPPPPPAISKYVSYEQELTQQARKRIDQLFRAIDKEYTESNRLARALRTCWAFNFHPQNPWRLNWDLMILMMVLFSVFYAPFNAAFPKSHCVDKTAPWWEWALDCCFFSDILLRFFTGFDRGFEVVMDRKQIAMQYVWPNGRPGWFFIDFAATMPWDQTVNFLQGGGPGCADGDLIDDDESMKVIKLLKLLKVARLLRMSRLLDAYTQAWTIHTEYIAAIKFIIYVFIAAHIIACLFFMWPTLFGQKVDLSVGGGGGLGGGSGGGVGASGSCPLDGVTCVYREGVDCAQGLGPDCHDSWRTVYDLDLLEANGDFRVVQQYSTALYWSLTTMTTIGYGDYGPKTPAETLFTIFAEVFGLCVFALLLNQISVLKEVLGRENQSASEEKNEVVGFLQHIGVEDRLIHDVVQFLNFKTKGHSGHALKETGPIHRDTLSMALRERIKQEVFTPALTKVRFFGHSKQDEQDRKQLRIMFDSIDVDKSGQLDRDEIKTLMKRLLEKAKGDMEAAFEEDDADGDALDEHTVSQAMKEMQGLAESHGCYGGGSGQGLPLSALRGQEDDGEVDFEEFQEWWYFKTHGRPKLPRCPLPFLRQLASLMSNTLAAHGEHELVVGHCHYVSEISADHDKKLEEELCGDRYGDEMWLVLTGTVVIIKSLPRDGDTVRARFGWGHRHASVMGENRILNDPDNPVGLVVPGSVNETSRTCSVMQCPPWHHQSQQQAAETARGASGRGGYQGARGEYFLTDLVIVRRAQPRFTVVGELGQTLYLRKHPTPAYGPGNCVAKVPVGAEMREVVGGMNRVPKKGKAGGEYIKVEWFDADGFSGRFEGYIETEAPPQGIGPGQGHSLDGRNDCDVSCLDGCCHAKSSCCRTVTNDDEEPIFGLAAALPVEELEMVQDLTESWFAETVSFVDMAYIGHEELLLVLERHWPELTAQDRAIRDSAAQRQQQMQKQQGSAAIVGDQQQQLRHRRGGHANISTLDVEGSGVMDIPSLDDEENGGGALGGGGGDSEGGQSALRRLALMDHGLDHLLRPNVVGGGKDKSPWTKLSSKNAQKRRDVPQVRRITDTTERFYALEEDLRKMKKAQEKAQEQQDKRMAEAQKEQAALSLQVEDLRQAMEHSHREITALLREMHNNSSSSSSSSSSHGGGMMPGGGSETWHGSPPLARGPAPEL